MTKQNLGYVNRYNNAKYSSVRECYGKPSGRKIAAEESIKREMLNKDGSDYKVISFNSNFFSCGYKYELNEKQMLRIETPSQSIDIELDD